jgi:hypothetical protein
MRRSSVPLRAATGSDEKKLSRKSGLVHAERNMCTSVDAVSRLSRDRPDPSAIRTPPSGTP